jgi:hypothetical protein
MHDFFDLGNDHVEAWPRDTKVDDAKKELLGFFEANPRTVFYEHQLEVIFERRFYHWITGKALHELAADAKRGRIASDLLTLSGAVPIRFYRHKSHRGWRLQAREILKLVRTFSTEDFSRGLGRHGEQMADAALPRVGFIRLARNTRTYNGRMWTETDHDLDRIYCYEDLVFGAEIKNRLSYMDLEDIRTKIRICRQLRLIPLFIVRMFPKSYFDLVYREGGISLILEYQLYPHGQHALARQVREKLRIPVDCPPEIRDETLQRLLRTIQHLRKRRTLFQQLLTAINTLPRTN